MLPEGDQTLVGERGVSLSGGQKARVNLARYLSGILHIVVLSQRCVPLKAHLFYDFECRLIVCSYSTHVSSLVA